MEPLIRGIIEVEKEFYRSLKNQDMMRNNELVFEV
jgi:hypothetical protein